MKKIAIIMVSALVLGGCGSSSEHRSDIPSSYQQAQTSVERTYELHSGTVKITCEYDEAGDEHCSGIYVATGQVVPSDVVDEVVESPIIDPRIEQAIAGGCENKILVLACELRDGYPQIAYPAPGEPDNPKNKEFIQKQLDASRQAMDEFVAANPGLLSDGVIAGYKSGYPIFEFNLNACDYADFIKRNKYKIYILELHGVVDNPPVVECSNEVDYSILFNENIGFGPSGKGFYKVFETADAYHQFIDSQKQYIEWEGFDFNQWAGKMKSLSQKIDFAKDNLIVINAETGSGSIRLMVTEACDGKFEVDTTWCAGKAMTDDMAYPMMVARIAKGEYQLTVGSKGLACDDSYEPLPGMVPAQKLDIQDLSQVVPACAHEISYEILKRVNLSGSGEINWNKQSAHVFHDMASFEAYLDTLRAKHLGEGEDGLTHEISYVFDGYAEEYKDFDFNANMLVALEGGSQPCGGYGMRIENACDNKVVYNVVWCDAPDIGYQPDIGYPFILASFAKGDYEFVGGTNSKACDGIN